MNVGPGCIVAGPFVPTVAALTFPGVYGMITKNEEVSA